MREVALLSPASGTQTTPSILTSYLLPSLAPLQLLPGPVAVTLQPHQVSAAFQEATLQPACALVVRSGLRVLWELRDRLAPGPCLPPQVTHSLLVRGSCRLCRRMGITLSKSLYTTVCKSNRLTAQAVRYTHELGDMLVKQEEGGLPGTVSISCSA